jgi:outer membrane receptor for ferrienterochelin and colicins
MYDLTSNIKLRGSYAQGYRAPQAFDEDLHIETVGGAALFTRLDPTLVTETSDSFTASINYSETSETWQTNLVAEAFYTALSNPFITANQIQLPSGVAVVTKRNGDGAIVQGVNLEANLAYNQKWVLNAGFTLQSAEYAREEEIWSPEVPNDANADSLISTTNILRTPHTYGYWSLTYNPDLRWEFSYSGVYTGKMEVPHVIDPETEFTIIEETPSFLEHNLKLSRNFPLGSSKTSLEVFFGVQNVFNAYQDDFDTGADRDAGYIYGPNRPRTVFFGLKVGME